jgi:hypothetical protein
LIGLRPRVGEGQACAHSVHRARICIGSVRHGIPSMQVRSGYKCAGALWRGTTHLGWEGSQRQLKTQLANVSGCLRWAHITYIHAPTANNSTQPDRCTVSTQCVSVQPDAKMEAAVCAWDLCSRRVRSAHSKHGPRPSNTHA